MEEDNIEPWYAPAGLIDKSGSMGKDESIKISIGVLKKFVEGMKKDMEQSPDSLFIDYQSDYIAPKKSQMNVKVKEAIRAMMKASKMITSEKVNGINPAYYSAHQLTIAAPEEVRKPQAPYVPLPVLTAPRSEWGKKMREKLDKIKAAA